MPFFLSYTEDTISSLTSASVSSLGEEVSSDSGSERGGSEASAAAAAAAIAAAAAASWKECKNPHEGKVGAAILPGKAPGKAFQTLVPLLQVQVVRRVPRYGVVREGRLEEMLLSYRPYRAARDTVECREEAHCTSGRLQLPNWCVMQATLGGVEPSFRFVATSTQTVHTYDLCLYRRGMPAVSFPVDAEVFLQLPFHFPLVHDAPRMCLFCRHFWLRWYHG